MVKIQMIYLQYCMKIPWILAINHLYAVMTRSPFQKPSKMTKGKQHLYLFLVYLTKLSVTHIL
jgi:hypothetical protein